ncbi:MAG: UDP-3-O-(3-hydroxymyristoyl)glucosamine N-acyltransferase [Phycisphaerales bacterium]
MSHTSKPTGITTGAIARQLGARLVGRDDLVLTGVDALDDAGPTTLTFIRAVRFAKAWGASRAGAALVSEEFEAQVEGHDPATRALLYVPDADLALGSIIELFVPPSAAMVPGVHPTAVIDPGASIAAGARIGPHCVVGADSSIARGCDLRAGVVIGAGVSIGEGTVLHERVIVGDRCIVGRKCTLWPGVIIGTDGFAYRPGPTGLVKVPHHGNVAIEDHVEIGANSTIDRARFGSTRIGAGTKIDNLVQIGHNCRIGRHVVICGCAGIAGSVVIGDGVMIGGGAGVGDNLTIGAGAKLAARSAAMRDIPAGESHIGAPAMPHRQWARMEVALKRLAERKETP